MLFHVGGIILILVFVLSLIVTPLIFIYSDQAVYTGCYGDPLDCSAAFGSPFFAPKKNTPRARESQGVVVTNLELSIGSTTAYKVWHYSRPAYCPEVQTDKAPPLWCLSLVYVY